LRAKNCSHRPFELRQVGWFDDSTRSQSAVEPVSVSAAISHREKDW
jgi:hypothetical protein